MPLRPAHTHSMQISTLQNPRMHLSPAPLEVAIAEEFERVRLVVESVLGLDCPCAVLAPINISLCHVVASQLLCTESVI